MATLVEVYHGVQKPLSSPHDFSLIQFLQRNLPPLQGQEIRLGQENEAE